MQGTRSLGLAAVFLLLAGTATFAGPCQNSIDELQARVDAAIENQAAADPSRRESLRATRSYQPTPSSIAASEGAAGKKFQRALVLLNRARAADRAGNLARCNAVLDKARSELQQAGMPWSPTKLVALMGICGASGLIIAIMFPLIWSPAVTIILLTLIGIVLYGLVVLAENRVLHYLPARARLAT